MLLTFYRPVTSLPTCPFIVCPVLPLELRYPSHLLCAQGLHHLQSTFCTSFHYSFTLIYLFSQPCSVRPWQLMLISPFLVFLSVSAICGSKVCVVTALLHPTRPFVASSCICHVFFLLCPRFSLLISPQFCLISLTFFCGSSSVGPQALSSTQQHSPL